MLQARLELNQDFGRRMLLYLYEVEKDDNGILVEYLWVPVEGGINRQRLKEGQRIDPAWAFLTLPTLQGAEFLRSMVVELAQHGYIIPDPHGTKVQAVEEHLATLRNENARKQELLAKLVDTLSKTTTTMAETLGRNA